MMDWNEYRSRCEHAQHCPHEMTWMVEPLVEQLNSPDTPVLHHDQTYLAGLINHLAQQIDEKDAQLGEGAEVMSNGMAMLEHATSALHDAHRKFLILAACWLGSLGVALGLFIAAHL